MKEEIFDIIKDFNAELERLMIELEFKNFYDVYCVTLKNLLLSKEFKKPSNIYDVYYIEVKENLLDLNKIKEKFALDSYLEQINNRNEQDSLELESYKKTTEKLNVEIKSNKKEDNFSIESKLETNNQNKREKFPLKDLSKLKRMFVEKKMSLLLTNKTDSSEKKINYKKIDDIKLKKYKYTIFPLLESLDVKSKNKFKFVDLKSYKIEQKEKTEISLRSFYKKDQISLEKIVKPGLIKDRKIRFELLRYKTKEKNIRFELISKFNKLSNLINKISIDDIKGNLGKEIIIKQDLKNFKKPENKNFKSLSLEKFPQKFPPLENLNYLLIYNIYNYTRYYLLEKNRKLLLFNLFSKLKEIVNLNKKYKINLLNEYRYKLLKHNYELQLKNLLSNLNKLLERNNNIKIDYSIYKNLLLELLFYNIILIENIVDIRNKIIEKLFNYNNRDNKTIYDHNILQYLINKNKDIIYNILSNLSELQEYNNIQNPVLQEYIEILLNYNNINFEEIQSNLENNLSRNNNGAVNLITILQELLNYNQEVDGNFSYNDIYQQLISFNKKPTINLSSYKENKDKLLSFVSFLITNPSFILLFEKLIKNNLLKRNKISYEKIEGYGVFYDRAIYSNEKYVKNLEDFDSRQKRYQNFIRKLSENNKSISSADSYLKEEEKSVVYFYRVERKTNYNPVKIEEQDKIKPSNIVIINSADNKKDNLPFNVSLVQKLISSQKGLDNFIVITNYAVLNTNRKLKIWIPGSFEGDIAHTVCFAPFIKDVSLNFNASYNSYNFLGRVEPYHTYSNSSADGSLSFYIFASKENNNLNKEIEFLVNETPIVAKSETIESLKKKAEFLIRLTRPSNNPDYNSSFSFTYPPICHLKVGNYINHDVVINSVSLGNIDSNVLWASYRDKEKEKFYPMGFSVDIRFNIYGQYTEEYDEFITTGNIRRLRNLSITSDDKKNFFFDV